MVRGEVVQRGFSERFSRVRVDERAHEREVLGVPAEPTHGAEMEVLGFGPAHRRAIRVEIFAERRAGLLETSQIEIALGLAQLDEDPVFG